MFPIQIKCIDQKIIVKFIVYLVVGLRQPVLEEMYASHVYIGS